LGQQINYFYFFKNEIRSIEIKFETKQGYLVYIRASHGARGGQGRVNGRGGGSSSVSKGKLGVGKEKSVQLVGVRKKEEREGMGERWEINVAKQVFQN
jgi:hypothetical protein